MNNLLGYTLEAAFHDNLREQSALRLISEVSIIFGTLGALGTTDSSDDFEISESSVEPARKLLASV